MLDFGQFGFFTGEMDLKDFTGNDDIVTIG